MDRGGFRKDILKGKHRHGLLSLDGENHGSLSNFSRIPPICRTSTAQNIFVISAARNTKFDIALRIKNTKSPLEVLWKIRKRNLTTSIKLKLFHDSFL